MIAWGDEENTNSFYEPHLVLQNTSESINVKEVEKAGAEFPPLLVKSQSLFYSSIKVAGERGFEPLITGPKPVALPLGYSPEKPINFISEFFKIQLYKIEKAGRSLITLIMDCRAQ